MRGCLVLSVLALSAVSLALPICAEAKSNSSIAKATAKGTHIKEGQITTKKKNGGVTGPVKPKNKEGTLKDIKGESRDSKHLGEVYISDDPPPPPPPPPPK